MPIDITTLPRSICPEGHPIVLTTMQPQLDALVVTQYCAICNKSFKTFLHTFAQIEEPWNPPTSNHSSRCRRSPNS